MPIATTALNDLAGIAAHLSDYMLEERSRRICRQQQLGHGTIAIDDRINFQCPASPVATSVFRDMAFERRGRTELEEFLQLAAGCRSMVDAGASGGFFSVLFSASRQEPGTLLSIEPDPGARAVLQDLRARNPNPLVTWLIDDRAISDAAGQIELVSSGYGAELPNPESVAHSRINASRNNLACRMLTVTCASLHIIARDHQIRPDIIKIDIESAEHELIASSTHLLKTDRPRLMLELHVKQLRQRGIDPAAPLHTLASLGYRRLRHPSRTLYRLASEADHAGVVRAGLIC